MTKARFQTGAEIFVIIIRRISEDAFLSFASIEPYFITEDDEKAQAMIDEYFPEGAEDVSLEMLEEEEEVEEEEEEEEMHYYEEDDIEIKDENREEFATYSFV